MKVARARSPRKSEDRDTAAGGDWLSLRQAAELLGVHPGTVRSWSDKGLVPVYRTRGGHRRFKRGEVALWATTARGGDPVDPAGAIQAALRSIRLKISEGQLAEEPWYPKLDDEARRQYRESGQTLFHGLMHHIASGGQEAQAEARTLGYEYARRAQRSGMNSADATRAFLFFRDAVLNAVIEVYQGANVPSGRAWGEVLRGVNAFTNLVLIELLAAFQNARPIPSESASA